MICDCVKPRRKNSLQNWQAAKIPKGICLSNSDNGDVLKTDSLREIRLDIEVKFFVVFVQTLANVVWFCKSPEYLLFRLILSIY